MDNNWALGTTFEEFIELRKKGETKDYDLTRGFDFSEVDESLEDYVKDFGEVEQANDIEQMQFLLFTLKENGATISEEGEGLIVVTSK